MIIESRNRSRYRTAVLQDNPIAYWRLGESSGTVAADVTGNYPGTYVGSPTLGLSGAVAGNTAFRSAAGKRMERNSEVVSGVLPFTLEAWVKTSTTTNQNILVVGNSATRSAGISVAPTTGLVGAYSNGSGGTYYNIYGGFARTGEWMHVVGVFESTGIKVYLNGIESTLPQSLGSASGYTQVKCGSWLNNADPTIGDIDEAAIYSSALSINRIIAHYYAGIDGVEPFDSDALDYFTRVEAAGSTINADNKNAINQFIIGCKADGNWTSIKASCILAGADTLSGALIPLVGTAPTTFNFSLSDYSTTTGLQGGFPRRFDTGRADNADPQDNCHAAVWVTNTGSGTTVGIIGSNGDTGVPQRRIFRTSSACNDTSGVTYTIEAGLVGITRSLSSSYIRRNNKANGTVNNVSIGTSTSNLAIFSRNTAGSSSWPGKLSFYSIGESINLALLDTRLAKLMNSLRPTYDVTALDYFARVEAAGSTINGNNKDAINQFIVGCKADGIWNSIKASCILVGADTLAGALVPLVGTTPTNIGFVADDYSRTTGLIGNGSSKFLSSNRPGNTDPQNSRHCAVWVNQVDPVAARRAYWGEYDGGVFNTYLRTEIDNSVQGGINGASGVPSITKSAGIAALSRLNSTVNYRYHGISGSVSGASVGAITAPTAIFAQSTTVAQNYSASRLSFYSLGENIDLALLDARLATLMSSLT